MELMYKIKNLFKNAFDTIQKYGFGHYGEKMFNIVICCLVTLGVIFGIREAVFPYLDKANKSYIEGKNKSNTSNNQEGKNKKIFPVGKNFEKILSRAKAITWEEASNIIKNNEGFYLHDVESNGIYINMKKVSQNNTYHAIPHGKYEFKILNSILNDNKDVKRRGGIIEYNNSYYIASYEIDKQYGDISIYFMDSKKDENSFDILHQDEIYKVLNKKEEVEKISL